MNIVLLLLISVCNKIGLDPAKLVKASVVHVALKHTNLSTSTQEKKRIIGESGCHDWLCLFLLIEHCIHWATSSQWGIGFVNEVAQLPDDSIDMAWKTGQYLRASLPLHPVLSIKPLYS